VGGVSYAVGNATSVRFDGQGGYDSAMLTGGAAAQTATFRPGSVQLVGGGMNAIATGVESSWVQGRANDTAVLYDSAGRDTLQAGITSVTLSGSGFQSTAEGFGNVTIYATAGSGDHANLTGSAGNDTLTVWAGVRLLDAGGVQMRAENFQTATFSGGEGWDRVDYYVTGKKGWLGGSGETGWVHATGFTTEFAEVESLLAHARARQKLRTELAALDYLFRKIGV
jgi:Ca2+-binding RTX toxin-like protein